jgi:hypothetical protein
MGGSREDLGANEDDPTDQQAREHDAGAGPIRPIRRDLRADRARRVGPVVTTVRARVLGLASWVVHLFIILSGNRANAARGSSLRTPWCPGPTD